MRLDFNVLWIEDHPKNVKSYQDRIESLIRREGFRLKVKFASSIEEAKQFLSNDIYGDHIDLILMDYDLGAGTKGDDGLVEVRAIFPYKDIIFYSSGAGDLLGMVLNKNVQGVYCSARDELFPDTVVGVFDALVKKVIDIDHSRGIVMGATSDIDYFINECLVNYFGKSESRTQKEALSTIKERMGKIRLKFEESAKNIEEISNMSELLEGHSIYTSVDRLILLRKLFESQGIFADKCQSMKDYESKTIPKRNDLAHVRVQIEGFSRKLYNRKGKELTSDEMKALRLELLENQEQFEELYDAVIAGHFS